MSGRSRRTLFLTMASAVAVFVTLSALAPAQNAQQRLRIQRNLPDLIVSGVQEPPDFAKPGDSLSVTITVANEGNTRARRATVARFLLSEGRAPTPDDIRMQGSARIPPLGPGQEFTRQVRVTIPANTAIDAYYLVVCADVGNVVREHQERLLNCKLSGQAVDLRDRPVGPPGPTGPVGPAGAAGQVGDVRQLPRTELDLGDKLFEPTPASPGDDEGSTQTSNAMTIGPITIRYLCRQTTNGDGGDPSTPFGPSNAFDEDGDEAKVLLYSTEGTFSFSSVNGQRMNIPAGDGTPGQEDEGGGEGKRQVLSAMHDPDPNSTRHRRNPFQGGGNTTEPEYTSGFRSSSAYVAHSGGTEFVLHAWAGIDVLGVGNDRCVFGGVVQVVQG